MNFALAVNIINALPDESVVNGCWLSLLQNYFTLGNNFMILPEQYLNWNRADLAVMKVNGANIGASNIVFAYEGKTASNGVAGIDKAKDQAVKYIKKCQKPTQVHLDRRFGMAAVGLQVVFVYYNGVASGGVYWNGMTNNIDYRPTNQYDVFVLGTHDVQIDNILTTLSAFW
ncbi:hypothetical protein ABW19_dt0204289 [Dactylella cylindrospora]|nr:hypothetical protein ABW19_dt0204289 [Dactylella cylindrospora]